MPTSSRRYSKEELAQRGEALYEAEVLPRLGAGDKGKFVAIDVESGACEMHADELEACDRLCARHAGAQMWLVRSGSKYLHRFGGRGASA